MLNLKLALISALGLTLLSCGELLHGSKNIAPNQSSVQTVEIPSTEVRNQGRFGVCWSYGTVGLIESVAKTKGIAVDLSEEAIVFYHLAESIKQMLELNTLPDVLTILSKGGIQEGWNALILPEDEDAIPEGVQKQHDALTLTAMYGVVPESAWSFKVNTEAARSALMNAINRNLIRLFQNGRSLTKLTLDEIMNEVLVSDGAFPSKPPDIVDWNGTTIETKNFLLNTLGFNTNDYGSFVVRNENEYDKFVMTLKEALVAGIAVPLAFPINIDRLKDDLFSGNDIKSDKDWLSFSRDGGHLVLVTDFVNEGSKRGALEPGRALQEMLAPASKLQEVVFKNSWGIGAKTTETGAPVGESKDGYYRMDQSYLKGAMRVSGLLGSKYNTVQAVLPKAILTK